MHANLEVVNGVQKLLQDCSHSQEAGPAMALLKVLLLLLGLGVAVSSVSLQKRVIGGQNCRDDERQYHVTVFRHSSTAATICGGSLISDQWVLTAAHCWQHAPGWFHGLLVAGHPRKGPQKPFTITQREVYKDSDGREHDIMLLRLSAKTTVQPIKLPDCPDTLPLGTKVQIAGYLARQDAAKGGSAKDPNDLQCAEFKIAEHETMEKMLAKDENFRFSYQKWYSVRSSKKDLTRDDSGGGCVFNNRLYGVYVYTGESEKTLDGQSVFLDVCAYKQWIEDTIK
ncbi:kallikrein 1-related peptidase b11-like [Gambusia affinis]|uniref:kallikrein 1-related peptidase b11-like n=1 Tax=Gambusia affinis TaxID=33528 RepID=UPI001CDC6D30|nr:kallikrein 1-related peptidase b11-like [Gambusia affinis]